MSQKVKTWSILELQKMGRFSEAGYGRIFAYDQSKVNAMVDARYKAKLIKRVNERNHQELFDMLYSGPTVFFDAKVKIKDYMIAKADLKSAYPAYLLDDRINKPGVFKIRHDGAFPLSENPTLYVIRFKCDVNNGFANWFLNSSAIQRAKIKTDDRKIWGEIAVYSSQSMNLIKYVGLFLNDNEAHIIKSYTFHGAYFMDIKKSQIRKLYFDKEMGDPDAKNMLVQSTGWLSVVDKTIYYHMVQYIKFQMLEIAHKYRLWGEIVGVQTDCIFYRITETNAHVAGEIKKESERIMKEQNSSIGTYKVMIVPADEVVTIKRRVVLK